jgi:hypothetical protein
MPTTQITNPRGAYGLPVSSGRTVDSFKANTAVGRRKACVFQGPTGGLVSQAGTNAAPALFAGIALEAAAVGDQVQLVTHGVVDLVPIDGAASVGALLKPGTTAGSLIVAGTPAVGDAVAIAISAASGGFATVKVMV